MYSLIRDVLNDVAWFFIGAAAGIALCKFWPEFWWFVNWGLSA